MIKITADIHTLTGHLTDGTMVFYERGFWRNMETDKIIASKVLINVFWLSLKD